MRLVRGTVKKLLSAATDDRVCHRVVQQRISSVTMYIPESLRLQISSCEVPPPINLILAPPILNQKIIK